MINTLNGFITIISNVCRIELYILRNNSRDSKNSGHPCTKKKNLCDQHIQAKNDEKCFFFFLPLCPHSIHSSVLPTPLLPPCNIATPTFGTTNASIATSLSLIIVNCQYCRLHHTTLSPRPSILSKFDIHIKIMGKLHFKS